MFKHYNQFLELIQRELPSGINQQDSGYREITPEENSLINQHVRYHGNIILISEGDKIERLRTIRKAISNLGFLPRNDTLKEKNLHSDYSLSYLMYEFNIGSRKLIDTIGGREIVRKDTKLCDRVYLGFVRYSLNGRAED